MEMTATPDALPGNGAHRRPALAHLMIAFLAFIAIAMPAGILTIAFTYMQGTFGLRLSDVAAILTVGVVGRLLGTFSSGALITRFGLSWSVIGSALVGVVGLLLFTIGPVWEMILLAAALAYVGEGVIDAAMNTFVSTHYGPGPMNWLHASYGIGLTLGPFLVTVLVVSGGMSWRVVYVVPLVLHLLLVFLVLMTRRAWYLDTTGGAERQGHPGTVRPSLIETLRVPGILLVIAFFFAYGALEVGIGQLANPFLIEVRAIPETSAAAAVTAYWLAFTIGRILAGVIVRYVHPRILMIGCMIGIIVGATMLALDLPLGRSDLALIVLGLALAPIFATQIAQTPQRLGAVHAPNAIGILIGSAGLGIAVLPGLASALADQIGTFIIAGYVVANGLLVILLLGWMLVRDHQGRWFGATPQ
jgi:fucose permease